MSVPLNRRDALKAVAAPVIVSAGVLSAKGKAPSDRLNVAAVGVAGRGGANVQGVRHENLVALCDVDANNLSRAARAFPAAKTFSDFRTCKQSFQHPTTDRQGLLRHQGYKTKVVPGIYITNFHAALDKQAIMEQASKNAIEGCNDLLTFHGCYYPPGSNPISDLNLGLKSSIRRGPENTVVLMLRHRTRDTGVSLRSPFPNHTSQAMATVGFNRSMAILACGKAWTQANDQLRSFDSKVGWALGHASINESEGQRVLG